MTDPTDGTGQFLEAAREYVEKSGGSGAERFLSYEEIPEEDWVDVAYALNRIEPADIFVIHRDFLRYQHAREDQDPSEIRFPFPPLNETLFDTLQAVDESEGKYENPLAVAIGRAPLHPVYISPRLVHGLTRKIPLLDAFCAFLYDQLTPTPQYLVADRLKRESYQEALDLGDSLSQSTLNRFPERLDDTLLEYLHEEIEHVIKNAQDLLPGVAGPTPTRRTLQYHLEKFSSTEITRRFAAANSVLFEEADSRGYFQEDHEIAIDITDWASSGTKTRTASFRGRSPGGTTPTRGSSPRCRWSGQICH